MMKGISPPYYSILLLEFLNHDTTKSLQTLENVPRGAKSHLV